VVYNIYFLYIFCIFIKTKKKNMKQKNFLKIAMFFLLISGISYGQLYQHDFGSTTISGNPYSVAPGTLNANLSNSSWTTSAASFASFAGSAGQALSLQNSSVTPTYTLTFDIASGFAASLTQFSFWHRRSSSGAQNWSMTINGISVGSGSVSSSGASTGTLDVSNSVNNLTGTVTVVLSLSGASGSGTFRLDDFTLIGTVDAAVAPGTPGISLSAVSGNTNEIGTTATFTAVLNAQPTTDVVLNISSANTDEVTVSPATLTFTNANWATAQEITLTGVDDILFDGNQDVIITVSVDDALSDDAYDAVADVTTTVTNEDNDIAPSIGFDAATSSENETDATFTSANIPITVANYSGTQIDINVSVTGGTAEVGDYTFTSPTALSFTADGSQNITVGINDDADTDGETIILTITETSSVSGLVISQATHTITIVDDEAPSFLVEDFTNSNATASYSDNSFTGNNSITWSYVASRNQDGDANGVGIDGNALMLRDLSNLSKVTSSTISGGIGDFSVKLYKGFTGAGDRQVELFINNISKGTSVSFDDADDKDAYIFIVDNINVAGDIVIEIRNILGKQVIIDDISWTAYSTTVTWDGSDSSDWATPANWDTNAIPIATDNVIIPDVTTAPIIGATTGALTNDLTITEPDGINITAGGSLIVDGTSTGNVTYNTTLGTENWYLASSPVVGETYDDTYVTANSLAINGTNNAIGSYATADNTWSYMQTGASGTFTPGAGYSVRRATAAGAGTISFTGTINTSDAAASVITGGTNSFNLIGNPFTAYLNSASFLTGNTANLVSETIWVWNQATGNYETKVTVDAFVLAPTQGFFINAASATNLSIAESYQATTGSVFQKTEKTEVKLMINDGTNNRFAKLYYLDNATTGFDNGYDGKLFSGVAQPFAIYTHLVADSEGKKYQVQSLPNSDFETMVISVGISADAGKEITFTADALNVPSGLKMFLEDRQTNTFTRLDEVNANYKVTLTETLNGVGRFYMHTTESVMSTEDVILNSVRIFKTNASTLKITGLPQGKTSFYLYNILGKEMMTTIFTANGNKEISLSKLASGIYLAKIQTEKGAISKKIILE
jgi:hypothetical protein